jgi:endonuclease/exonuclease/phosphatase family metal-dependent hydrolase
MAIRKFLKISAIVLLIPVVIFAILIGFATLTDFRPDVSEVFPNLKSTSDTIPDSVEINLLIWNIGYCGLDKKMDFFYDGGTGVRTPEEQLKLNFASIRNFLQSNDSVDMLLLQEVDIKSKRSYRINEVEKLSEALVGFSSFYGKNYDVFFVPLPPMHPMGAVNSGLLSLSRIKPATTARYSFPGQYAWPKRLFMLDRCFLVMRFPVSNGRELLVINTHNEAYDDGTIRDQQMTYLKEFLLSEYKQGNYIIAGGDWNQCPSGFKPQFTGEVFDTLNIKGIDINYIPLDWQWVYNPLVPTNRRLDISYTKGETLTTVIDFFLLSPNIRLRSIKTTDLGFENSDHQPVSVKIALE